jgi:hypothetical protein
MHEQKVLYLCYLEAFISLCYILLLRYVHCNENPIYVFPEKELRDLSPNFHIHVSVRLSVSYFYISRIGPHFFLQQNRQTNHGNI